MSELHKYEATAGSVVQKFSKKILPHLEFLINRDTLHLSMQTEEVPIYRHDYLIL